MSPRRRIVGLGKGGLAIVGLVNPKKTVQVLSVLIPLVDKRTALCI